MQHTHRLAYLAGHMFIDLPEGRFLVDTGSPASFGDAGTATYGGRAHELPRSMGGVDLAALDGLGLRARIGARLRGLIGMDVIGTEPVLWDGERGRAIVRPPAPDAALPRVRFERAFGAAVPVVRGVIGGREGRLVFDTGAQFGYLASADDLAHGDDAGNFTDYHPMLGEIASASTRMQVGLVADAHEAPRVRERFGFHAPLAERILRPLALDGILGCSWMPARRVWLRPAESALVVE
jgi:hypothetical protein